MILFSAYSRYSRAFARNLMAGSLRAALHTMTTAHHCESPAAMTDAACCSAAQDAKPRRSSMRSGCK